MEDETVKRIIMLTIGLIVVVVFYYIWKDMSSAGTSSIASLIPDATCPKGAKVNDYVTRMQTFASGDSRTPEPSYAIDVFKQYLGCKNPKTGTSVFSSAEIEQNDRKVLSCANSAYINYLKELDTKKTAVKGSEEDVQYYAHLIDQTKAEYETFKTVFPTSEYSGTMCNYPATGRDSAVV